MVNDYYVSPTPPQLDFEYDVDTRLVTLRVTAEYIPNAALVLGATPYNVNTRTWGTFLTCENHVTNSEVTIDTLAEALTNPPPDTVSLSLMDGSSILYPESATAGRWTRSIPDCTTVRYTTSFYVDEAETICTDANSVSPFTMESANSVFLLRGSIFVTYVYVNNGVLVNIDEHELSYVIASRLVATAGDLETNLNPKPTFNNIRADYDAFGRFTLELNSKFDYTEGGRLCDFSVDVPDTINPSISIEACDCINLCGEYCPDDQCSQAWSVTAKNDLLPGETAGEYLMEWAGISCDNSSILNCGIVDGGYAKLPIVITEEIQSSAERDRPEGAHVLVMIGENANEYIIRITDLILDTIPIISEIRICDMPESGIDVCDSDSYYLIKDGSLVEGMTVSYDAETNEITFILDASLFGEVVILDIRTGSNQVSFIVLDPVISEDTSDVSDYVSFEEEIERSALVGDSEADDGNDDGTTTGDDGTTTGDDGTTTGDDGDGEDGEDGTGTGADGSDSDDEGGNLGLILALSGAGLVVLGGLAAVFVFLKKKK
ncbi:hypothetical protein ADUPG1_013161 [Aduncisulcus paluster]|uniref:Egg coat matrix protein n=1 Tax=Aduncisulcus paluster TaxID=2918883 RepID=A0ABQ5K3R2_9EUKA|nr:hypothetical protein ADUPG1_013161 [Aduncisulcus paluster]